MLNWLSNGQLEPFQTDSAFGAYKIFQESSPRPVLKAEDIMRTHMITAGPQCSVVEAISLMNERAVHHLPVIDEKRFGLSELADGLRYLEAGRHVGKVCIDIQ